MTARIAKAAVLFLMTGILTVACSSKGKTPPAPTPPQFIEDLQPSGPVRAQIGDTITVDFSVFCAKYLVLDHDNPAEVLPGAGTAFEFEKKVYTVNESTKGFPIEIPIKVGMYASPGPVEIKFGLRIYFRNRADNQPQVRNTIFTVPVEVVLENVTGTRKHWYPMEYKLE